MLGLRSQRLRRISCRGLSILTEFCYVGSPQPAAATHFLQGTVNLDGTLLCWASAAASGCDGLSQPGAG